jgi:ATP-binding cassette subfamily F protein 3
MDDLEESVGQRALTAALTAEQVALLEEAGVVDYLTGSLDDPDATDDDLLECMAPMLVDTAVAEDDDAGAALAAKVLSALRGLGGGSPEAPVAEKLLSAPVSMFALVAQDETAIVAETAKALGPARVNFNSTIGTQVNTLITEDDDSPEAMARRYKMQRRGEKRLKRDARREKVRGMMMEEFMRELTRDPVVLHWRGGSGGSSDILLKDVSMDMGGQLLLEDTSVTLVFGRKYGLVGRNGIGKTTFLKFLSAHRFEGVPPQLQILHIEQEVAATGLSILETVLATDIERAALLEEEAELLAEVCRCAMQPPRWPPRDTPGNRPATPTI